METDLELLVRYRRGDASAMDQLVDRHGGAVYAFVRRFTGDPSGVDDLTQDVWLRVLRHSGSFDGRSRFTTWLFTVTRNTCIDQLRRKNRRDPRRGKSDEPQGPAFHLEEVTDPSPPVLDRVARRELSSLIEEAVGELPEAQREVFIMREQTDLTFQEIASVLDLPRDTVKSRMRYALGHLRKILRGRLSKEASARGV